MNERSYLFEFLLDWYEALRLRRLAVFVILVVCIGLGLLYSFTAEETFRAEVKILPPQDAGGSSALLSQIYAMTGLNAGSGESLLGPLYPEIARSRWVIGRALDEIHEGQTYRHWFSGVDSLSYLEEERLIESVRKNIDGSIDNLTGIVSVGFTNPDRSFVAPFMNSITAKIDAFFDQQLASDARERHESIVVRLNEIKESLSVAEISLMRFQTANRSIELSPSLSMDQARLQRDVDVNSSLYIELKRQLEVAKVEEVGNIPTLDILSRAMPPVRRHAPRRAMVMAFALAMGALLAVVYVRYAIVLSVRRSRSGR